MDAEIRFLERRALEGDSAAATRFAEVRARFDGSRAAQLGRVHEALSLVLKARRARWGRLLGVSLEYPSYVTEEAHEGIAAGFVEVGWGDSLLLTFPTMDFWQGWGFNGRRPIESEATGDLTQLWGRDSTGLARVRAWGTASYPQEFWDRVRRAVPVPVPEGPIGRFWPDDGHVEWSLPRERPYSSLPTRGHSRQGEFQCPRSSSSSTAPAAP